MMGDQFGAPEGSGGIWRSRSKSDSRADVDHPNRSTTSATVAFRSPDHITDKMRAVIVVSAARSR
jgi:hypothetical protein